MFQIHELLKNYPMIPIKMISDKSAPKTYQESRVVDVIIVSPT